MLNKGLLGAGRIAGVHATSISTNPGSRLVAVSNINAEAAGKIAEKCGCEVRTTDAILADAAIHAVLIATSTITHSDLIEWATAAGKAILCEKPVYLSLARARLCEIAVM
jgi:myo-inositol 2-dehydrogenase/D-chiro-inositol 1-dehydrogenase